MPKIKLSLILSLIIFLIIELLSFSALFLPIVNQLVFWILVIITLALTIYKLEYGLLMVLAELFVGSLGHLFFITVDSHQLSIRIALWLVVMLVFSGKLIIQLIKERLHSSYFQSLKKFSAWKIIGILFLFILLGVINGLWRHNNLSIIFLDVNAWLYFLLIFPAIVVYSEREKAVIARLRLVFLGGTIWLSLETLFLLFVFTHKSALSAEIYIWLRKTIVGEVTPTLTGWPRIFIQSQFFSAIAFFMVLWFQTIKLKFKNFFHTQNLLILTTSALFLTTLLLSFSRSFWVGLVGALIFSLAIIWKHYGLKRMLQTGIWVLLAGIISLSFIYVVAAFPYWHTESTNFSKSIIARTDSRDDAAIASRWSLLPALTTAILKAPIMGQGFGSTVTYYSRDPRVLQNNPSGLYTTYAFEWGYLSIWLKIGLLGLIVYLGFLLKLILASLNIALRIKNYLFFALATGVVFLTLTNIFTPYLNHPLGIGFLVISSCLIWPNRVY